MKIILTRPSLIERAIELETRSREFYKRIAEEGHDSSADLFSYMSKQKDLETRTLSGLGEGSEDEFPAEDDYAEAFNLYVAPYLDGGVLGGFDERSRQAEAAQETDRLQLALEFEKEMVLLYSGMMELMPAEIAARIKEMNNRKRQNILALQDSLREMDAGVDDLLTVAFNRELLARRFYLDAAERAGSEKGKRFFAEFADFEKTHAERIKGIIESRNRGAKLEISWDAELRSNLDPEIEGEVEPNRTDIVDVMIMAVEAEKNANARYLRIADMLDDAEGKSIFKGLANDERTHQKLLEDQLYHMSNSGMIIWE